MGWVVAASCARLRILSRRTGCLRASGRRAASSLLLVAHRLEGQHDQCDKCGDGWHQVEQANKDGIRVFGGDQCVQAEYAKSRADQKEQRSAQQLLGHRMASRSRTLDDIACG